MLFKSHTAARTGEPELCDLKPFSLIHKPKVDQMLYSCCNAFKSHFSLLGIAVHCLRNRKSVSWTAEQGEDAANSDTISEDAHASTAVYVFSF